MAIKVGAKASVFKLYNTDNNEVSLYIFQGQ